MSLNKGLIGHWKLDSSEPRDSSAYDRHGVAENSPNTNQDGVVNKSWEFPASSSASLEIQDVTKGNLQLEGLEEFTICGWANINQLVSSRQDIIHINSFQTLIYLQNGDYKFAVNDNSNNLQTMGTEPVTTGEWHHVAGVAKNGEMKIYIDGELVNSKSISLPTGTSSGGSVIGNSPANGAPTGGLVDDARVYDRGLSQEEIQQLYQMRAPREQRMSLSDGLVGHWKLDRSKPYDSSAQDNHGAKSGGITTEATGIVGQCYKFDGTDDYIDMGDKLVDWYTEISVSTWIKPDSLKNNSSPTGHNSNEGRIIHKAGTDDDNFGIGVASGGTAFYLDTGSNDPLKGSAPPVDKWTHLVATYDGSSQKIYINGSLDVSKSTSGEIIGSKNALRIGGYQSNVDNTFFDGKIDDMRVYNRALSQSEIEKLYNVRSNQHMRIE